MPQASAEGTKEVYFASIRYVPRIPANDTDTWSLTVHNINCTNNGTGQAWFFLAFYIDGESWWDEYNNTNYRIWRCDKGQTVTNSYKIDAWNVMEPVTRNVKVELYWYLDGKYYLKDVASFNIDIALFLPLHHIYVFGYLVVYLMACFILFLNLYVTGLEED